MEKDMQIMIIIIALLTQKNVTHNCKTIFVHPVYWLVKKTLHEFNKIYSYIYS